MGVTLSKDGSYDDMDKSTPMKSQDAEHFDPRSPTIGISRTPIQFPNNTVVNDPRSPSVELTRTPIIVGLNNEKCIPNADDEPSKIQNNMKEFENNQPAQSHPAVTPVQQQQSQTSLSNDMLKDPIKQKLLFDSPLNSSPVRSPLTTRNCHPEQPMDIVRRKQLQKVVERMNIDQEKENIISK